MAEGLIVPERHTQWGDLGVGLSFPPKEAWLINPYRDKFETPVDDRGLIDVPTLIESVKDTVDEDYEWPSNLSIHHLYWHERHYDSAFAGPWARRFRELPIHKAVVPRVFENWLHLVTLPPDVPDPEVMRARVESWGVAEDLFHSVRQAVVWEKRGRRRAERVQNSLVSLPEEFKGVDVIGKEVLQAILGRHFNGMERHLARLQEVPPEFRLAEPTDTREILAKKLGKIIGPRALHLVRAVAA